MDEPLVTPTPRPEGAAPDASPPSKARRELSAKELAARRANIAKAHAADKNLIYRSTERRQPRQHPESHRLATLTPGQRHRATQCL